MNKRLLLVEPPFYRLHKFDYSLTRFPLALGYLAGTVIRNTNWRVRTYNADFFPQEEQMTYAYCSGSGFRDYLGQLNNPEGPVWDEIKAQIEEYRPSVVGISTKSQNFAASCIVAGIAKTVNPAITVVVGGPHPSLVKTEVLKQPHIDYGVCGEGEMSFIELLEAIEGKKPIEEVQGIVYRRNGAHVQNSPRAYMNDLDSLPFPIAIARETLVDFPSYPARAFSAVFATRGCQHNCSYCGSRYIWSRKVRFRSPANVLNEMEDLWKAGVPVIEFQDDTFGVRKSYISELCSEIMKSPTQFLWNCEIHVSLIDPTTVSLMKQAGCSLISLGVESGSNTILRKIRKGFKIEKAVQAAQTVRRCGIPLSAFFMVGFPQETEETLDKTIKAINTFPCDAVVYSIFTPYPGTELFDYCRELGIVSDDFDIAMFHHQSPLNYFCPNIPQERFNDRLRLLERRIDRINRLKRLRRLLSPEALRKLRYYGLRTAAKRVFDIFRF